MEAWRQGLEGRGRNGKGGEDQGLFVIWRRTWPSIAIDGDSFRVAVALASWGLYARRARVRWRTGMGDIWPLPSNTRRHTSRLSLAFFLEASDVWPRYGAPCLREVEATCSWPEWEVGASRLHDGVAFSWYTTWSPSLLACSWPRQGKHWSCCTERRVVSRQYHRAISVLCFACGYGCGCEHCVGGEMYF